MEMNYRKINQNEINTFNKIQEINLKTQGNRTEQDLINFINQLVSEYKKRGYTEKQLSQLTFYRYIK